MARSTTRCVLAAALVLLACLGALARAPAVAARGCDDMTALVTSTTDRTALLVSLPDGLSGSVPERSAFTATQAEAPVPVLDVQPGSPADVDVALVVDTAAGPAESFQATQEAAAAALTGLPVAASAAVVSTDGRVALSMRDDPRAGLPVVQGLEQGGSRSLVDAIVSAVRQLPADPSRQQHVLVVTAGADEGSSSSWDFAESFLARRGVALDLVDLATSSSLPGAGAQCPGPVRLEDAGSAGQQAAARIGQPVRVTLPVVDLSVPVTLRVEVDGVSASAAVQRRGELEGPSGLPWDGYADGIGVRTLALALLLGIAAVCALLLGFAARSSSGHAARHAVLEMVRARRAMHRARSRAREAFPGEAAEARRRWVDALQDLNAAIGTAPTARALAENEARVEELYRAELAARDAARWARAAARERAAKRLARTAQRADEAAAEQRALREARRLEAMVPLPSALHERAAAAAVAEAERVLADQRGAVEAAVNRRRQAERAADEAVARAREQQAAAAAAQQARAEAEQAAQEAELLAKRERRSAGEASDARREAEAAAARAAGQADEDRVAADAAAARRLAAEAQAAEAEADRATALAREEGARQAAEEAETARRAALARLDDEHRSAQPVKAIEIDLRASASERVEARTAPGARPPAAVALSETRARRLHMPTGVDVAGVAATIGGSDLAATDTAATDTAATDAPATDAPANAPATELNGTDVAGGGPVPAEPPDEDAVPGDRTPAVVVEARPAEQDWIPVELAASGDVADALSTPVSPVAWLIRTAAAAVLPLAVTAKTAVQGTWWEASGPLTLAALGGVLLLCVVGCRWLWVSTRQPRALLRRDAARVLRALRRQAAQEAAAAEVLMALRAQRATPEMWDLFEYRSGLTIPGSTRSVVDPEMDPSALVRYLAARQQVAPPQPQSLAVVTLVPVAVYLVPAVLVLAFL